MVGVGGFNLFCSRNLDVIVGRVRGEVVACGVTNKLLRGFWWVRVRCRFLCFFDVCVYMD